MNKRETLHLARDYFARGWTWQEFEREVFDKSGTSPKFITEQQFESAVYLLGILPVAPHEMLVSIITRGAEQQAETDVPGWRKCDHPECPAWSNPSLCKDRQRAGNCDAATIEKQDR